MEGRRILRASVTPVVVALFAAAGVLFFGAQLSVACTSTEASARVVWQIALWSAALVAAVAASSVLSQKPLVRSGDRDSGLATSYLVGAVLMGLAVSWFGFILYDNTTHAMRAINLECYAGLGEEGMLPLLFIALGIPCESLYVIAWGRAIFVEVQGDRLGKTA